MSALKLYRQFVRRLGISMLLTLMDAVIVAVCLSRASGEPRFWLIASLTVPLLWTLLKMWKRTLADAAAIEMLFAAAEKQDQKQAKQAA
jgi:hypothetical protein